MCSLFKGFKLFASLARVFIPTARDLFADSPGFAGCLFYSADRRSHDTAQSTDCTLLSNRRDFLSDSYLDWLLFSKRIDFGVYKREECTSSPWHSAFLHTS